MAHACVRAFTRGEWWAKLIILTYWISSFFSQKTWTNQVHDNNSFHDNTCPWFFKKKCCYILLSKQISLSDCLYISKYWTICVSKLIVNQAVMSQNLKLLYLSNQVVTWPRNQDKTLNILRMKRAFEVK